MDAKVINQIVKSEDHEEGEIIDVDQLEPISSDEEDNLRERIRELETRNAELEKLATLAREERKTYNYGEAVTISSEDETYQERIGKRKRDRHHRSPEQRRRRSLTPEHRRKRIQIQAYFNKYTNSKNHRTNRPSRSENRRTRRPKRKRSKRSTSIDSHSIDITQLNAALQRDINGQRRYENPLIKRLNLHEEHSNKENDSDDDEELIALRLQALQSKQEVKELTKEILEVPNTVVPTTSPLEDEDEQELRMIALKSAIAKKAETRRMQNCKPYSPTDEMAPNLVDASPAMDLCSDNENSSNNMEISPTQSPALDDVVLQPIDMEIATPDNVSNSPTFYAPEDPNSIDFHNNIQTLNEHDPSLTVPVPIKPIPTISTTLKMTKGGTPIRLVSVPVQEEIKENLGKRQNTRSPSNLIMIEAKAVPTDAQVRKKPKRGRRKRIRKQLGANTEKAPISQPSNDDDEEETLRALLLSTLKSQQRQQTSSPSNATSIASNSNDVKPVVPCLNNAKAEENKNDLLAIEDNLKKAAKRIKELTDHEQCLINSSLDQILSTNMQEKNEKSSGVNLKDVVARLKQKNSAQSAGNSPVRFPSPPKISLQENEQNKESLTASEKIIPLIETSKVFTTVNESDTTNASKSPKTAIEKLKVIPRAVSPLTLKPKQITAAMADIKTNQESVPKKVTTVIMKRKLKTKSSIVNVPFQLKPVIKPKETNNIPLGALNPPKPKPPVPSTSSISTSSSRLVTSLDEFIRPVPKLVIELGQSSSESSISSDDEIYTEADSGVQSKLASPSHIVEYSTSIGLPNINGSNTTEAPAELAKSDILFELKLDEFLKQARAKTELTESLEKENSTEKCPIVPPKIIKQQQTVTSKAKISLATEGTVKLKTPITPTSLRHLPVSSQIEYKALVAKMQLLERQKTLRQRFQRIKNDVHQGTASTSKVNTQSVLSKQTTEHLLKTPNSSDKPLSSSTPKTTQDLATEHQPDNEQHLIPHNNSDKPKKESQTLKNKTKTETLEDKLTKLSVEARERMLKKSQHNFDEHSHIFLDQLSKFITNIDEAHSVKQKQIHLEHEVADLRAKLHAMESQLDAQKKKSTEIFPVITQTHKRILQSRDKYIKLSKVCNKIGVVVKGTDYQYQNRDKLEICERLKVLTEKTKQLKQVRQTAKVNSVEEKKETSSVRKEEQHNIYKSVLDCLTPSGQTTNPDGVVCPFEISGQCLDKECKYVHLATSSTAFS